MGKYRTIINTPYLWAKERRWPGRVEVYFGLKYENEKRGHAVFVSGAAMGPNANGSERYFYKEAKGISNYISGPTLNTLIIENEVFVY